MRKKERKKLFETKQKQESPQNLIETSIEGLISFKGLKEEMKCQRNTNHFSQRHRCQTFGWCKW